MPGLELTWKIVLSTSKFYTCPSSSIRVQLPFKSNVVRTPWQLQMFLLCNQLNYLSFYKVASPHARPYALEILVIPLIRSILATFPRKRAWWSHLIYVPLQLDSNCLFWLSSLGCHLAYGMSWVFVRRMNSFIEENLVGRSSGASKSTPASLNSAMKSWGLVGGFIQNLSLCSLALGGDSKKGCVSWHLKTFDLWALGGGGHLLGMVLVGGSPEIKPLACWEPDCSLK